MKEVTITGYDHQGRGISKIDNKIVFVPNTIIGEKVNINIITNKKSYMEGEVISWVTESPTRTKGKCRYYPQCGGCDLLHIPYCGQLKYKQDKVNNIMTHYVKEKFPIKDIIASPKQFHYRNKVTLHGNHKCLGFYERKSNKIVKIDTCLLLDNKLNEYLKTIKPTNKSIIIRTNGNDILSGDGTIIKKIGQYNFLVSLSSFFQINDDVTYLMYEKIKEYANGTKKDNLLDLYCGTGSIGIYLSQDFHEVLGIEINKQAIKDAKKNKELNKISNISFIASDVNKIIDEISFKPSIVVVDPPRAGLDQKTIDAIIKMQPQRLIYTSCDPMTLARDLNRLKDYFDIIELTPFDMFPNTYHVECVVWLEAKKR